MSAYYTYISKKQIGVIFRANKTGEINVGDDIIKWLYNSCAEVRGYCYNNHFNDVLNRVKAAVDAIFNHEYEEAENLIIGARELHHAICGA